MLGTELLAPLIGGVFQTFLTTFLSGLVTAFIGAVFAPMGTLLPTVLGGLVPGLPV
jgi:hypothetical protein